MDLEVEVHAGRRIVRLHERSLDAFAAHGLRMALASAAAVSAEQITVDLSQVEFIDSAGLGVLVAFGRRAGASAPVELAGARPGVTELLRVAGLDELFRIVAEPEGAVAAIS